MSDDYSEMDLDDLLAARAELISELGELETAIAELVAEETAECSDEGGDD